MQGHVIDYTSTFTDAICRENHKSELCQGENNIQQQWREQQQNISLLMEWGQSEHPTTQALNQPITNHISKYLTLELSSLEWLAQRTHTTNKQEDKTEGCHL